MKPLKAALVLLGLALVMLACSCMPSPVAVSPAEGPTVVPTLTVTASPTTPPTPGPVKIIYWEEETDDGAVVLDELAAAFMKANPDILVERAHLRYSEMRDLYRAAALSGKAPDLVRAPSEFAGPFSALGIVQPAAPLYPPATLNAFFPGALEAATVRGVLWGLPDNYGGHLMLIYNKDLVSEVPPTTNAWIAQLRTLTGLSKEQYGLVYDLNEPFWLVPWIGGYGDWPLDAEDRPTLDTQAMVDALQFTHDLKLVHGVVPQQADYERAYELFKSGQAAYIIDGAWNLDRYVGVGLNVGVTALPRVSATGLAPTPMTTGKYWLVSEGIAGPRLDAAARFVLFMTSAEAQEAWLAKARRLPSDKATASSPLIAGDPILAGSMAQLSLGRGLPAALEMSCVWSAMKPHLTAVVAGEETATTAAAAMQADADSCVAEMNDVTPSPEGG